MKERFILVTDRIVVARHRRFDLLNGTAGLCKKLFFFDVQSGNPSGIILHGAGSELPLQKSGKGRGFLLQEKPGLTVGYRFSQPGGIALQAGGDV